MPAPFRHQYTTTINGDASLHADPRPTIVGGPPPELDGDAAAWSPEHLLLGAVGLGLESTFAAYATRTGLPVIAWRADVSGTLDRTAAGLAFTRIVAHVEVSVAHGYLERARALLDRARRSCIIAASLNLPVEVDAHISTPAQPA
jgi:organic hydroperoxide reductase OsmC/OhrA